MSKWGGEWLVERVKGDGGSGAELNVMTVCNTGSLATSVGSRARADMCTYRTRNADGAFSDRATELRWD